MTPASIGSTPPTHPWITPNWPAPAQVRAVFTTRLGGVSAPPFEGFNLGDHVGDAPGAVAANRAALAAALGVQPVFLQQVHGTATLGLTAQSLTTPPPCADAVFTRQRQQVCTIMVADCLPILLTDTAGSFVAAVHAGWRGLAAGVLADCLLRVRASAKGASSPVGSPPVSFDSSPQSSPDSSSAAGPGAGSHAGRISMSNRALSLAKYGDDAIETIAWLGPCIGPQAFEVGPEVRDAFLARQAQAERHFLRCPSQPWPAGGQANQPNPASSLACAPGAGAASPSAQASAQEPALRPSYWADLAGLARDQLRALGVHAIYGNDSTAAWCTVTNPSRFFSHRRDHISGRMAACVWLV